MALTLTYDEFVRIHRKAQTAYNDAVYSRYQKRAGGCTTCTDQDSRINKLYIYLWILDQWEQDNYNWELYNNCVNSRDVQNILKDVEEIS